MLPPVITSEHRTRGSVKGRRTAKPSTSTYRISNGTKFYPWSSTGNDTLVYQRNIVMSDIVVKDFHSRSKAGEIFNNSMHREETIFNNDLVKVEAVKYLASTTNAVLEAELAIDAPQFTLNGDIANTAYINAVTDSFAGVTANEVNSALWVGEAKEALSMFTSIGKSALDLWNMTKKQRKQWRDGKLSVEGQQSLTLGLLYGILPLEQQIADFYDGLFGLKADGTRDTSRGYRNESSQHAGKTHVTRHNFNENIAITSHSVFEETLDINVRAGVLYEIDVDGLHPGAVILDPKSIVSTTYALARLSFVIDWFINVGGTLAAWSPSVGVNHLSSWATVEIKREIRGQHIVEFYDDHAKETLRAGTGEFVRTSTIKWRKPTSRTDSAVIPRLDINLNTSKILSMVLLFAKVRKDV